MMMNSNIYPLQANPAEQSWESQKQEMAYWADVREIEKTRAKACAVEEVKVEAQKIRLMNKEVADERKRSLYETVEISPDGVIQVVTKNLSIPSRPRDIISMRKPIAKVYRRKVHPEHGIMRIEAMVEEQEQAVYVKLSDLGNGTHLLKLFASKGITVYADQAKAKRYVVDLVTQLARNAESFWVYDSSGWVKLENGEFMFVDEGEITWEWLSQRVEGF